MKIRRLFDKKTVLSFEVFPPKRSSAIDSVYRTAEELAQLKPDFISVTYGAGGTGASNTSTVDIAAWIKKNCHTESVAHLPCIYLSEEDARKTLEQLKENNIENILALRGDKIDGNPPAGIFKFASDLTEFIKDNGDFHVIGACYPEGHFESETIFDDITNLKRKTDAGADHLVTQLFFDNEHFYRFRERATIAGIKVPIQAGIMPVVNKNQIERMVSLCGASLPSKFTKMMQRYENNPQALRDAGIAYAINQIVDLITQGVDGIHLYTMNDPEVASRIHSAVHSLISAK